MEFEDFGPTKKAANENKPFRAKAIPVISTTIEFIALFALAGVLTLIQFNFAVASIVWDIFILYLALRLSMIFLAKDAAARSKVEQGQGEQDHEELVKRFKLLAGGVNIAEFEKYVETVENPRRKISAYKSKITPKIEKFSKKNEKYTIAKKIAEFKKRKFFVKVYDRKIRDLSIKIDALKVKISDNYIAQNIDIIKVKYKKVRVNEFFVVDLFGEVDEHQFNINVGFENKKGILRSLPLSAAFIMLITLIGLDSITFGAINIVTLFLDLLSIAGNFAVGWFAIGTKTLAKQRKVIANKITFIEEYKNKKAVD